MYWGIVRGSHHRPATNDPGSTEPSTNDPGSTDPGGADTTGDTGDGGEAEGDTAATSVELHAAPMQRRQGRSVVWVA